MPQLLERYGYKWPISDSAQDTALRIEMSCIKKGIGQGLSFHYEQMRRLIWPELDVHRWHNLTRDEIVKNKVTVLMGPKSTAKTHEASWYGLCKWMVDPENTCILVSSTDIRGLKLRIWGELTMLWQRAIDRFNWLPGHLLDSKVAITYQSLTENEIDDRTVRDMRCAIVGIPCIQGGKFVGLGKYCGIKQKKVLLIADELQFMSASFLSAFANLDGNDDFQAICLGNPNDIMDSLGKAAEPKDGWASHMEPDKTTVWDTRFMNGRCVNLIGTDSPNMDFPADQPTRYKYLISREKIANTASFFSKDSIEFYSQCIGSMKIGQLARRVITRDMCRQFHAFDDVIWEGSERTRIGGLDAAYGGDRCICGHIEFGRNSEGSVVISVFPPQIVPIKVTASKTAEECIAEFCRNYCEVHHIPPQNFGHDSTGRGSLGTFLARVWSDQCNPIEFGGNPTERPVSLDLYIYDPKIPGRRLKRCSEHYRKFVTELWFSVRYAIESAQVRNLPEDVMEEGCMREWDRTKDDKIELETKVEMKERVGRSPDLFDWFCWVKGTLILTPDGQIPIENLKLGDEIITPFGTTKIAIIHESFSSDLTYAKFSNGKSLIGRSGHKVFTWENGWIRLDSLSIDNEIETCNNIPVWHILNTLFTKVGNIGFKALVDIIKTGTRLHRSDFYTELSGKSIMAKFRSICASITKMVIGQITDWKIWNLWKSINILDFIFLKDGVLQHPDQSSWIPFQNAFLLLPNGTVPKKVKNGIAKTQNINGSISEKTNLQFVQYAAKNSCLNFLQELNTAHCAASTYKLSKLLPVILEFVQYAAKNLLRINIAQLKVVPVTVEPFYPSVPEKVYNLTLEQDNVYFANNILVENCICVEMARRRGFQIKKLANADVARNTFEWMRKERDKHREFERKGELVELR